MARGRPRKNDVHEVLVKDKNLVGLKNVQLGVASVNFNPHLDQATGTVAYNFSIHLIPKDKWEEQGITEESTEEFINQTFENCKRELLRVVLAD